LAPFLLIERYYFEMEGLLLGISPTFSGSELAEERQIWPGLFEAIEKAQNIAIE
jgi:hypothetical protein